MGELAATVPPIAARNNHGIDIFEAGRLDDAIEIFSELSVEPLAMVSQIRQEEDEHTAKPSHQGMSQTEGRTTVYPGTMRIACQENINVQWVDYYARNDEPPRQRENDREPFVFGHAIKIVSFTRNIDAGSLSCGNGATGYNDCCHNCLVESCPMPAWIIVYNHAIACHLQGLACGESGNILLYKSHLLYYAALRLMVVDPFSRDTLFAIAAIHNNQVCVLHELGMHSDCMVFRLMLFDELMDLTMRFSVRGKHRACMIQFLMNVLTLDQPRIAAAA